jgi:hypothetical protein
MARWLGPSGAAKNGSGAKANPIPLPDFMFKHMHRAEPRRDSDQSSFRAFWAALPMPPFGSSSTALARSALAPFLSPWAFLCWPM